MGYFELSSDAPPRASVLFRDFVRAGFLLLGRRSARVLRLVARFGAVRLGAIFPAFYSPRSIGSSAD